MKASKRIFNYLKVRGDKNSQTQIILFHIIPLTEFLLGNWKLRISFYSGGSSQHEEALFSAPVNYGRCHSAHGVRGKIWLMETPPSTTVGEQQLQCVCVESWSGQENSSRDVLLGSRTQSDPDQQVHVQQNSSPLIRCLPVSPEFPRQPKVICAEVLIHIS